MLVLSRKYKESVVIGGTMSLPPMLTVTVLEIRNGRVKLGFDGDPSVPVQRSEVWTRIRTGEWPTERMEDFTVPTVQ